MVLRESKRRHIAPGEARHLADVVEVGKSGLVMERGYIYIYPIGSMYGIYANIGGILMINVTIVRFKQSHLFKNPPSL